MKLQQSDFDNLVNQGLVQKRMDSRGYSTYKYKNNVFYKNLWYKSPLLLEARGLVFDSDGEIAQRPFRKVFNIGENGTKLQKDKLYKVVRKVNGFMACASWHNGDLLVSTTGTTTSEYADLATTVMMNYIDVHKFNYLDTFIFEIVDESDPHIVPEVSGPYLIGVREKDTGLLLRNLTLKSIAANLGCRMPEDFDMTGSEILENIKDVKHEGFAIYDYDTNEFVAKIKSPHYLSKKAMMRMGTNKADWMFDNPKSFKQTMLDEEFWGICGTILGLGKEYWLSLEEQDRRKFIEEYFYE